jgi:hypothetical protein
MKANLNLSKKVLSNLFIGLTFLSLIFVQCTEDRLVIEPEIESSATDSVYLKSTAYIITVTPSKNLIKVGDCLYFTGTVTQGGKPVSGLNIGVEDPIKQQSIPKGATTDSKGKFIYNIETMCPAMYNDMVGAFEFKFIAGNVTVKSKINVATNSPSGLDELTAINNGTSTYLIKLMVDNQNKGTYTVSPGKSINLFQGKTFGSSTIVATILNSTSKILWKATYTDVPTNLPQSSTFQNPLYINYMANSTISINGVSRTRSLNGIGNFYSDFVNKEWTVGGYKVKAENSVTHGVATKAEIGVEGPNCKTFLGFKAKCSASVGVSAGLQLCAGWGAGWAIGPVTAGANAKCCVEVASVKCNVAEIGVAASAKYK